MKTKLLIVVAVFFAATLFVPDALAQGKEARLVRDARITMAQARKTALARIPGNVEFGKLEREKGKLWFEFEIHKAETARRRKTRCFLKLRFQLTTLKRRL